MQSPILVALTWIGGYLILTLLPLLVPLLHPMPQARGFWIEFSVALGFIGLALMVLQFVLAARVNLIEKSYGVDLLIGFHRYTSTLAFVLILAHPIILFINSPEMLELLNFPQAPLRARLAMLGTLSFLVMLVTTIWRKQLHIPYEPWRCLHSFLAILAVGLGFGHAWLVGYYLDSFLNQLLWGSFGLVGFWLIFYVRIVKPLMMMKRPYKVESVTPQPGNVWVLALRPIGHPGFEFKPGQFSWLTLNVAPLRMREHPFSMSSSGDCKERIEFGIKELGDFTKQIKDIKPGTKAYLDGPYGAFTTAKFRDSSGFVLIAGGVGITPIYSMLLTASKRNDKRPFLLIYAAKSWDQITFRDELEALKKLSIFHDELETLKKSSISHGELETLKKLSISHDELEALKKSSISHDELEALKKSSISHDELETLKKLSISHDELETLKKLSISHDELEALKKSSISHDELETLKKLSISHDELEALKKSSKFNLKLIYVLSQSNEGWQGETGRVDRELLEKYIPEPPGSQHYFICANPKMMDDVERALFALDVPVTNIHMEHFNLA